MTFIYIKPFFIFDLFDYIVDSYFYNFLIKYIIIKLSFLVKSLVNLFKNMYFLFP